MKYPIPLFLILLALGHNPRLWGDFYSTQLEVMKPLLTNQRDHVHRRIWRSTTKKNTIHMESFISKDVDLTIARKVLSEPMGYRDWALHNLNKKSSGDDYRIRVTNLTGVKDKHDQIILDYQVGLPLFQLTGKRFFKIKWINPQTSFHIQAISMPKKNSILKHMELDLKAIEVKNQPNQTWIHLTGHVTLNSTLLYEALPQNLLDQELNARISRLVDNYISEEDKIFSTSPEPQVTFTPKKATQAGF